VLKAVALRKAASTDPGRRKRAEFAEAIGAGRTITLVSQSDGLKLERPGLEHMPPDGTAMARGNLEILWTFQSLE
jgi:hypothetical protein